MADEDAKSAPQSALATVEPTQLEAILTAHEAFWFDRRDTAGPPLWVGQVSLTWTCGRSIYMASTSEKSTFVGRTSPVQMSQIRISRMPICGKLRSPWSSFEAPATRA